MSSVVENFLLLLDAAGRKDCLRATEADAAIVNLIWTRCRTEANKIDRTLQSLNSLLFFDFKKRLRIICFKQ